jgi:hypothetical protein
VTGPSLESDILELILETGRDTEVIQGGRVEDLMVRSFRAQVESIAPYGAYVRHLGLDPARITQWQEIPPVPASAFKSHDLSAAPPGGPGEVIFETSGTTISQRGRVRLSSTLLYYHSLLRTFSWNLLPDRGHLRAVVFGPPGAEATRSSLWFMVDCVIGEFSAPEPRYVVQHGEARWKVADDAFREASSAGEPLLLIGTTLLFMAYFARLRLMNAAYRLPPGSRAMDTGGAKGLTTEFTRAEVAGAFQRHLGIPPSHLVNEYGMAEMASQFYDGNLRAHLEGRTQQPGKRIPPWVRTRVLDPETLEEQPEGDVGLLVHYDLANVEIPLAIQTEDIGRRIGDRLILEGRLLGAEARGCSLSYERFLAENPA